MRKVEQKYQCRNMSGEWNTLTQEQEEIIALKARLASLNAPCRQIDTTCKKKKIFENSNNRYWKYPLRSSQLVIRIFIRD
jgi:hypothetical protein